jgi:phage terminase large subunit GpA-like protein
MQTWEACVRKWLEAWDDEHGTSRDNGQLQVFYNNVLGETFEVRSEKIRFEQVSPHRRDYRFGQVPNRFATEHAGGPVMLLTCAVDVHADQLPVAVFGWCRDRRAILIDYWRFEGNTEQLDDPGTWCRLRDLIENKEYVADDGKRYRIQLTLIDSGYRTDQVYRFAGEYEAGVFPVKGREFAPKNATIKEFSDFTTPNGLRAYGVTVDMYKDRWSAALRRGWSGQDMQPIGHFNAPLDATDKQLKELTVEVKRERFEATTKKKIGYEWHRPGGAANELWDLLIYSSAGLDLIAWDVSRNQLDLEFLDWSKFYDICAQQPYFTLP